MMGTAKIINDAEGQIVELPESCRFDCDEIVMVRAGRGVILAPRGVLES